MKYKYEAVRCKCGHYNCKSWWVEPSAAVQGVGFTEDEARAIADLLNGNRWVKLEDVRVGDRVRVFGLTCVPESATLLVEKTPIGEELFVPCSHGKHFLREQLNDDGRLVGVEKVDRIINERRPLA